MRQLTRKPFVNINESNSNIITKYTLVYNNCIGIITFDYCRWNKVNLHYNINILTKMKLFIDII